jgi:hypothetical protein
MWQTYRRNDRTLKKNAAYVQQLASHRIRSGIVVIHGMMGASQQTLGDDADRASESKSIEPAIVATCMAPTGRPKGGGPEVRAGTCMPINVGNIVADMLVACE